MLLKISYILVLVFFVSRVQSSCTNVTNEDKIDCVQHESWTVDSCLAKGCCHAEVAGFPACFFPYGNKHEARCAMSVGERSECGNADTTEIGCINSGCCWQMTPGSPYCYHAHEGVTDGPSTVSDSTDTSVTTNPAQCAAIKDDDKIDCAANDPKWTAKSCLAKGCCHIEVAGYPACFYAHGLHHDPKCQMTTLERKDCGDAKTTAIECEDQGCCWQMTPGAPYCFHKKDGDVTDVTDVTDSPNTDVTDSPNTDVTGTVIDGSTASPSQCKAIKDDDKIDCAANDPKWTAETCVAKGCCHIEVAGYPACYYAHGLHHDKECQMTTLERKDCGDAKTTAIECEDQGCCWQMTPGAPYCFHKKGSVVTDNPITTGPNVTTGPVVVGKGCDMPINVREEVHKGTKQECESAGLCWRPGGGSPNCYKPHNGKGVKVYIHMMPWFETKETNGGKWGQHWTMANVNPDQKDSSGKRKIASKFYPLIDLYASGDPHVVEWQLGLMKLSGVSGVLIDWPGTANVWDYPTNHKNCLEIVKGCKKVGLEYAFVYEDHNLGMARDAKLLKTDMITQGKADMAYLRDNHFGQSNHIKVNGAPLLLDFGPQTLIGGSNWEQLFSVFTQKPTFLTLWNQMEQGGKMAKGEFAWIYSNYIEGLTNFYHYKDIDLKFGCAYPGFDSAYTIGGWPGPTWTIPVSVSTFEKTLDLAMSFGVNYIQVATWNDYGEGTIIEPTKEFGYGMLTTLQRKMGVKHTQADLEKVTQNFHQRRLYSDNSTMLNILDRQYEALVNFH